VSAVTIISKGFAMSWRQKLTDHIADVLRFAASLFLAFDAIVLSMFVFWFLTFFLWRFAQYINHSIFENPWY
jgi:hypothetical protein